jgi:Zn-finger nucleic acid-binding protein
MDCPKCKGTPMMVVEHDGVELDHCAACGGTWFDRDELGLLLEGMGPEARAALPDELASLPEAETGETRRRCPTCRRKMRKIRLGGKGGVLIDACPRDDGLWFDEAEVWELAEQIAENLPEAQGRAVKFMGRVLGAPKGPDREEGT